MALDRVLWEDPQPRGGVEGDPDAWAREMLEEGEGAACMLGLALLFGALCAGVVIGWLLRGLVTPA